MVHGPASTHTMLSSRRVLCSPLCRVTDVLALLEVVRPWRHGRRHGLALVVGGAAHVRRSCAAHRRRFGRARHQRHLAECLLLREWQDCVTLEITSYRAMVPSIKLRCSSGVQSWGLKPRPHISTRRASRRAHSGLCSAGCERCARASHPPFCASAVRRGPAKMPSFR